MTSHTHAHARARTHTSAHTRILLHPLRGAAFAHAHHSMKMQNVCFIYVYFIYIFFSFLVNWHMQQVDWETTSTPLFHTLSLSHRVIQHDSCYHVRQCWGLCFSNAPPKHFKGCLTTPFRLWTVFFCLFFLCLQKNNHYPNFIHHDVTENVPTHQCSISIVIQYH